MAYESTTDMLRPYGVPPEAVVTLNGPLDDRHIAHLDLHRNTMSVSRAVEIDAVVEMNGRPVLYVRRGPPPLDSDRQTSRLAQRGTADYVAFVEPGQITVLPLIVRSGADDRRVVSASDPDASGLVPGIAFGTLAPTGHAAAQRLRAGLFGLIQSSTVELTRAGVMPDDALAFVGRALFLRFLIDREIVTNEHQSHFAPRAGSLEGMLATPALTLATNAWLDREFNGDLLPLDPTIAFRSRARSEVVCEQLTRIITRAEASGQLCFEWDRLDFGRIPPGLLSEVYESWSHEYTAHEARRDSVWYTPVSIANLMVAEALGRVEAPHSARVLDPSAGAGVFLVAAFRALVAARWKHDGRRPDRKVIREILYRQITGFDIHDAGLRLAALALYLTALELDPDPDTAVGDCFEDLRAKGVLRNVGPERTVGDVPPIGSLARDCASDLRGCFDVVVGNPPWTAWAAKGESDREKKSNKRRIAEQRSEVEVTVTEILRERTGDPTIAFTMIQNEPDVAMLWCATRWARPGGIIALALHAHILFRRTTEGLAALDTLLRGLTVTAILNGAALRETKVWPQHKAPFALLFALNHRADERTAFAFVSPMLDASLNRDGYVRVDAAARHPVHASEPRRQPWLLKTLFRGGPMDAPIMERIQGNGDVPLLGEWWPETSSSRGFSRGGGQTKKRPCPELMGRAELVDHDVVGAAVTRASTRRFRDRELTEPRTGEWKKLHPEEVAAGSAPTVFRGPLVLVRRVPRADERFSLALMSEFDLLYNDSFFGFSAAWSEVGPSLARYLTVILNSRVTLYTLLLSGSAFGVERTTLELEDLRSLRIPRWESLSESTQHDFVRAWETLRASNGADRMTADEVVGRLFNLSSVDLECIADTLSVALPIDECAQRAQRRPDRAERETFRKRVESILAPMLRRSERALRVEILDSNPTGPWCSLWIATSPGGGAAHPREALAKEALALGVREGASRVVLPQRGGLFVSIFAQYRYWTVTQARALAMDVLHEPSWMSALRGVSS